MNQVSVTFRGAIKPATRRGAKAPAIELATPSQPTPRTASPPPVSRAARQLALAYAIERAIEDGRLKDYAEAARLLGVERARVTQIVNLLLLPTDEQGRILFGK